MLINLAFYMLIFQYTPMIGAGTGWGKYEFFVFFATGLLINSLVQTLFMTNARRAERPDPHRHARLRPAEADRHPVLVSLRRIDWSSLAQFRLSGWCCCWLRAGAAATTCPGPVGDGALPASTSLCGVADLLQPDDRPGGGQRVAGPEPDALDFWFYITNFSRYPMEIYAGPLGTPLRRVFTFIIPVLVVVNVPARLVVRPLRPQTLGTGSCRRSPCWPRWPAWPSRAGSSSGPW